MAATIGATSAALRTVADHETGAYKWYVAATLCAAHTVAIIDRFVMVLVTEPIRATLHLSDTQLGLLQGTGFAILYCGFAVPLGAVADAANRRNLIMTGLVLWSLATVAAAFATSFETLFATRFLVGLGEACLVPAGMSLLAAYFAPANLARGTAIFGLGANFGYGFAFLGGGALLTLLIAQGGLVVPGGVHFEPWEAIFLAAGALAVPVLVLLLWLREPPRAARSGTGASASFASLRDGLAYIWENRRGYAPFLLVGSMTAVTGYAVTSWSSSLFVRMHGMTAADAGKLIGLIGILAGPLGTISGGIVLDRLRGWGVAGAPLVVMGFGSVFALLFAGSAAFAPNLLSAGALFCLFVFESTFVLPALYVGIQLLTPDRFRGVAASFNMMIYTLAGLGLGPTAVGAISDLLHKGDRSLGLAIVIVEIAMVLVIVPTAILARRGFQAQMHAVAR
jgi:MFS family permease